jgi:uncharacterized surface protein with fasciclin (FAS1) repeats
MNSKKFFTFSKYTAMIVVILSAVFLTGCDDDDDDVKPTKNIWELVQDNGDLGILEAQLQAGGLDATLQGTGQYTLFAPSDAAMNTLLSTLGLDNFESISDAVVQQVLKYHIANSEYLSGALTDGAEITTAQGEKIKVVVSTTGEKRLDTGATSDSKVTTADIRATNGVIHVVDIVLVPPTLGALIVQTLGTVAQPLLLGSEFTILADGLRKADEFATTAGVPTLTSILIKRDVLYTVFAPTNATFNAGNITAASFTGQQWYGLLANHVVAHPTKVYGTTADFTVGLQLQTLANVPTLPLTVISTTAPTNPTAGITTGIALNSNATLTNAEAQIAVLDVLAATGANPAENGIINVIAGVLSPQ